MSGGMMKTEKEQLSLAVYSLKRVGFRYGMYAFITGCDDFSCTLGMLLLHSGAAGVTMGVFSSDDEKKVQKMGFTTYMYGSDNVKLAEKLTDGRLFDLVFETTGKTTAYDAFIDMMKRGAVAGILARLDEAYTFFVKTAVRSQIRFIGLRSTDEQSSKIAQTLIEQDWRVTK